MSDPSATDTTTNTATSATATAAFTMRKRLAPSARFRKSGEAAIKAPIGKRSSTVARSTYSRTLVCTFGLMSEKNGSIRFPTIALRTRNGDSSTEPRTAADAGCWLRVFMSACRFEWDFTEDASAAQAGTGVRDAVAHNRGSVDRYHDARG